MKWALVAAGVSDLQRPAEKLSVSQNLGAFSLLIMSSVSRKPFNDRIQPRLALAATGTIWVRYSLVIIPINYSLAAVSWPCPFIASQPSHVDVLHRLTASLV